MQNTNIFLQWITSSVSIITFPLAEHCWQRELLPSAWLNTHQIWLMIDQFWMTEHFVKN